MAENFFENKDRLFESVKNELLQASAEDQKMRNDVKDGKKEFDPQVDIKNTDKLKRIILEMGWPTKSKFGEEAAHAAWMIAQHSDKETAFQRLCLEAMKNLSEDEIEKADLALLEDRVRIKEGKPQLYGTQFSVSEDGKFEPEPIEDENNLDKRRKEMGLEPFLEYKTHMMKLWREHEEMLEKKNL